MAKQRMRRGEPPRESDALVLRGGDLDHEPLRHDAEENFRRYGFYGLSVWIPGAETSVDDILASKLVKSAVVHEFRLGDLRARSVDVWDTGQFPHYDGVYLAGEHLDELVTAVLAASRTVLSNQFYDPEGGPDR